MRVYARGSEPLAWALQQVTSAPEPYHATIVTIDPLKRLTLSSKLCCPRKVEPRRDSGECQGTVPGRSRGQEFRGCLGSYGFTTASSQMVR